MENNCKEWLNFLLSPDYNVIRSPKSNSQVGVPLSVIAINEKHNLGILKQEFLLFLKWLSWKIIKPTIKAIVDLHTTKDLKAQSRK
jgi:alanine racemase